MLASKLTFFVIVSLSTIGKSQGTDYANWMQQLSDDAKGRPITRLSIPGSHNSFTYQLDRNSNMADNTSFLFIDVISKTSQYASPAIQIASAFVDLLVSLNGSSNSRNSPSNTNNRANNARNAADIGSAVGNLGPMAKSLAYNWSRTQDLTTLEQLNLGIRYFDARLGYEAPPGRIRIAHGLYGKTLLTEMTTMAQWARQHPDEVIIIYFRAFFTFNVTAHRQLVTNMKKIFNETLLAYQTATETRDLSSISLSWLSRQSPRIGNVIVIYNEQRNAMTSGPTVFWPTEGNIITLWASSTNLTVIRNKMDWGLNLYTHPVDNRVSFFLEFQGGVATADGGEIAGSVFAGTGLRERAIPTRDAFDQWLLGEKNNTFLQYGAINLCLSDLVDKNYVDAVLALN